MTFCYPGRLKEVVWFVKLIPQRIYQFIFKSCKIHVLTRITMIKLGHNFADTTTSEHSGIVQTCYLIGSLFTQRFCQAQIKENINAPRHWHGDTVTGEFPAQMASDAEKVSIWWCHIWWRHKFSMMSSLIPFGVGAWKAAKTDGRW